MILAKKLRFEGIKNCWFPIRRQVRDKSQKMRSTTVSTHIFNVLWLQKSVYILHFRVWVPLIYVKAPQSHHSPQNIKFKMKYVHLCT